MLFAWYTPADPDHKADPDVLKTAKHIYRYTGRGSCPIFTTGQDGDGNVVFAYLA